MNPKRKDKVIGTVSTAIPFARMVVTRAPAMLPPADPVITTPLLNVVGIIATRKIPILIPGAREDRPKNKEMMGAAIKIRTSARVMLLTSLMPAFIWLASRRIPENRKMIKIAVSAP